MIDVGALLVAVVAKLEGDPALAARLGAVLRAGQADDLVELDEAARIAGVRSRVLQDEARRERIDLVGRRGHLRVRRAELVRWMMTPARLKSAANDAADDGRDAARASVAAAAARAARGGR